MLLIPYNKEKRKNKKNGKIAVFFIFSISTLMISFEEMRMKGGSGKAKHSALTQFPIMLMRARNCSFHLRGFNMTGPAALYLKLFNISLDNKFESIMLFNMKEKRTAVFWPSMAGDKFSFNKQFNSGGGGTDGN